MLSSKKHESQDRLIIHHQHLSSSPKPSYLHHSDDYEGLWVTELIRSVWSNVFCRDRVLSVFLPIIFWGMCCEFTEISHVHAQLYINIYSTVDIEFLNVCVFQSIRLSSQTWRNNRKKKSGKFRCVFYSYLLSWSIMTNLIEILL